MLAAALFTMTWSTCKADGCTSADGWLEKAWPPCKMEHHSALQRNEVLIALWCRQTLYHLRLRTLHYLETNFRTWLVTLPPPSVDIGTFLGMPSVTISVSSNLTILQAASESWSGKVTNTQAKDSEKSSSQYLLSHFYRLWAWACFLYNLSYEI